MKIPILRMVDRDAWLCSWAKGARAIHLGCADNPLTEARIAAGRLLHQRLVEEARTCVGLDLDALSIETLRALLPEEEFIVGNVEHLRAIEELRGRKFDLAIAADVLEHVSNPGLFLDGIDGLLEDDGRILVTTPHAFSIKRLWGMAAGHEHVHPDHVAYFSISTIKQLAMRSGFVIEDVVAFQWSNPTVRNRVAYWFSRPFLLLTRNRVCDELGVVLRRV